MSALLEVLAEEGVDESLDQLMKSSEAAFDRTVLENLFQDHGAISPTQVFDRLLQSNVLQGIGERFGLSRHGRRLSLLISAINGADVEDVFFRLRGIEGQQPAYELVRQGMTSVFFDTLLDRGGFGSLYICSPWINPTDPDCSKLKYAMTVEERRTGSQPKIQVVTRPPEDQPRGTESGLDCFRQVGATIYYRKRLHTKLYIREPALDGGVLLAIVGSENLTRSNLLELGIMISGDDRVVNELVRHFVELVNFSDEARE